MPRLVAGCGWVRVERTLLSAALDLDSKNLRKVEQSSAASGDKS
jgi:hypothetical protein